MQLAKLEALALERDYPKRRTLAKHLVHAFEATGLYEDKNEETTAKELDKLLKQVGDRGAYPDTPEDRLAGRFDGLAEASIRYAERRQKQIWASWQRNGNKTARMLEARLAKLRRRERDEARACPTRRRKRGA